MTGEVMGGKQTKVNIDLYRNERYPQDIKVTFLPGKEIIRYEHGVCWSEPSKLEANDGKCIRTGWA
jgi:hypothetical protein